MGVPAFFRWLAAKYPLVMQQVVEDEKNATATTARVKENEHSAMSPFRVDNLYLDTNGIVHPCCHPEDGPQPTTEEEMHANVAVLIDRLVAACRPSFLLYIALDGVAPRAKVNQQRTRRFCTAREAAEAEEARKELGIVREGHISWDSNQITPGTPFMARLAKFLRSYVAERQRSGGPLWRNLIVVIDDAFTPGEGEHKIIDYIRRWRASSDYTPSRTHAICGQDADLIMLALALHEPNVVILRERIEPPKKSKSKKAERAAAVGGPKGLDIMRMDRLRQYLLFEFAIPLGQPGVLSFPFDLEYIIQDFIFICIFVGNDFLPRLPSLEIREGGLDMMLVLYKHLLPALGGYLCCDGDVNLARVEVVFSRLAQAEATIFRRRAQADERFEQQRQEKAAREEAEAAAAGGGGGGRGGGGRGAAAAENGTTQSAKTRRVLLAPSSSADAAAESLGEGDSVDGVETEKTGSSTEAPPPLPPSPVSLETSAVVAADASAAAQKEGDGGGGGGGVGGGGSTFHDGVDESTLKLEALMLAKNQELAELAGSQQVKLGEAGWRERYYERKLGASGNTPATRQSMVEEYVRGLCWVTKYYHQGVPSWSWYFPHHYSPFATDLVNLHASLHPITFELGQPFPPLTQLMAVLPPASVHCVPSCYADLMTSPHSPVADCYPTSFELDPNGKPPALRWLWVARLPFLDAPRLEAALATRAGALTKEEKARNERRHAEVCVSSQHPLAAAPVQGLARRDWANIAGFGLAGEVKALSNTTTSTSTTGPATAAAAAAFPAGGEGPNGDRSGDAARSERVSAVGEGGGLTSVYYSYRQPALAAHSSRVHPSFVGVEEPLPWPALQASVPKRRVRMPLFDDEIADLLAGRFGKGGKGFGGRGYGKGKGPNKFTRDGGKGVTGGGGGGGGDGRRGKGDFGKGVGGGGGGAGRGKGAAGTRSAQPCWYFSTPAGCSRGASCMFMHG